MLLVGERFMPKQCPECSSFADDDVGYCPGCACMLEDQPISRLSQLWSSLALLAASLSIAGAACFYFWRDHGR